ncbi:MAG: hypothetical protein CFE43_01625 [Burkholderiales bacterium PBB3]|nr:MAG: hypothetical protein CFE43_01625 [Burkholderiales bacterium PBB3]
MEPTPHAPDSPIHPQRAGRWWPTAQALLATSAGVGIDVLEERGSDGRWRYPRGRQKYYGLGALVLFFAIFSGFGMGHMVSAMGAMPFIGAVIAGLVWAVFQWCLERQMVLSISPTARWPLKCFGFTWRSMLALLSALTLVYPFFVASNRAEIDVHTAHLTRDRLIRNAETAPSAAGVPALQQALATVRADRAQVELDLRGEPPQLAHLKQLARACWSRHAQLQRQLEGLRASPDAAPEAVATAQRQQQAQQLRCTQADTAVGQRLQQWQDEKSAEKKHIDQRLSEVQALTDTAWANSRALEAQTSGPIKAAGQSGFAADFTAVADWLRHDPNRQIQFLWWTVWFFIIELVAIVVKFMSTTDVDYRLQADETWAKAHADSELTEKLQTLAGNALASRMQAQGVQADLAEDAGATWQLVASEQRQHEQALQRWQRDISQPVALLEAALANLQAIDRHQARSRTDHNAARTDPLVELARSELMRAFERTLASKA